MFEPQGLLPALRAELAGDLERRNASTGTELVYSGEYLVVIGTGLNAAHAGSVRLMAEE